MLNIFSCIVPSLTSYRFLVLATISLVNLWDPKRLFLVHALAYLMAVSIIRCSVRRSVLYSLFR